LKAITRRINRLFLFRRELLLDTVSRPYRTEGIRPMIPPFSALWSAPPPDLADRLDRCLDVSRYRRADPLRVFFRADDVAVPGRQLARLIRLFAVHRTPLSLAVVPAWLTRTRWRTLASLAGAHAGLWCWHQHGWRHVNHEAGGKKQEFGPGRSRGAIHRDLARGRQRLEEIMGDVFFPAFTPPWNRCDPRTLDALTALGFQAVSRFRESTPPPPAGLPEIPVHVDLHTRKETSPALGWQRLWGDLAQAFAGGCCGIMLHHRCMNAAAFDFLELLLQRLANHPRIAVVHLADLVAERRT
jgi:hypothetical protein